MIVLFYCQRNIRHNKCVFSNKKIFSKTISVVNIIKDCGSVYSFQPFLSLSQKIVWMIKIQFSVGDLTAEIL